jgi:copper chaperone
MADHTYKFNVTMSCGGCSGAVERALNKLKADEKNGITNIDVKLEPQEAYITTGPDSQLDYQTVLSAIQKTGKKVTAGYENGETRGI